jgi:glycosyltransferase involved in cell wall biosynthesis
MKIAVFLPRPWRGGMLRAVQGFCSALLSAAVRQGRDIELVLSIQANTYKVNEIDLTDPRLTVRETRWTVLSDGESRLLGIANTECVPPYVRPTDGGRDFMDCSLWIVFGAYFLPEVGVLAPLRPYYVYVPDLIQRNIPQIYGDEVIPLGSGWLMNTGLILTIRHAERVLVTTPQTAEDAVGYAGAARDKVILMPLWLVERSINGTAGPGWERPYLLWVSNTTPHKNHSHAIDALEKYYEQGGTLDTLLVGALAHGTSVARRHRARKPDRPYWRSTADKSNETRFTSKRLHFLGEVSDRQHMNLIAGARFVWHNVLYDSGSFIALDTAHAGVPLLSSDYPEMRYVCDVFNIPCSFFSPTDVESAADALGRMERSVQDGTSSMSYRKPERWQETLDASFDNLLALIFRQ